MRIRMIWLVLPAILAASQADHALAQERIDTSNFSAAAKAELSDGAQAVDILNRFDALLDPALVGFLDSKVRRFQVFLYDFLGDQLWPAPKGHCPRSSVQNCEPSRECLPGQRAS